MVDFGVESADLNYEWRECTRMGGGGRMECWSFGMMEWGFDDDRRHYAVAAVRLEVRAAGFSWRVMWSRVAFLGSTLEC